MALDDRFELFRKRYFQRCLNDIKQKIEVSRDKEFGKQHYLSGFHNYKENVKTGIDAVIISEFEYQYKLGYDVPAILDDLGKNISEKVSNIEDFLEKWFDKYKTLTLEERDEVSKDLHLNHRETLIRLSKRGELLKFIVRHYVFLDLLEYFSKEDVGSSLDSKKPSLTALDYDVIWTGDTKTGKIDFVKLIYGLFYAGLLNSGNGEITKIVQSLAKVFKVDLGINWKSNLSKNRTERNTTYNQFQVFDAARSGYDKHLMSKEKKI